MINADKRASQLENVQDQLSIRLAELELAGELVTEQAQVISDLQANLAESERKRGRLKKALGAVALVIIGETLLILL